MKPYLLLFFFYRKTASISLLGCQAALTPHRFDAPLKLHCKNFLLLHSERFANVNYSFIVKEIVAKQQFGLMLSSAWALVINLQDRTITGICIFISTNILIFWASQSCVCLLFSPPQGSRRTSWLLLPFFQNKAR